MKPVNSSLLLLLLLPFVVHCGGGEGIDSPIVETCLSEIEEPQDCYVSEERLNITKAEDFEVFCNSPCTRAKRVFIGRIPGVQDLRAMGNITELEGLLFIDGAQDLETLRGLENLRHIGGLWIDETEKLKNLDALESLEVEELIGGLRLGSNSALERIDGLEPLRIIDGNDGIYISSNPRLGSLEPLRNVESAEALILFNNESLRDLSGLEAFEETTGGVRIEHNANLESLRNLESFRRAVALTVRHNPKLPQCEVTRFVDQIETTGSVQNYLTPNGPGECAD